MLTQNANKDLMSCDAICEATHFESHTLWLNYFKDTTINYKQLGGYAVIVGKIGKVNIGICVSFIEVNNKRICYWEPMSYLVDTVMIQKYLDLNTKKDVEKESPQHFHYTLDRLGIDYKAAKNK